MKGIIRATEKRVLLRRILLYSVAAFFLGVLQCSFFSRLKPFGAVPDLILGSVGAIALSDNKKAAAVYAVGAGYFIDAIGAVTPSFSAVFYLICAALSAIIAEKLVSRFFSYVLLLLPLLLCRGIFTYVNLWIAFGSLPPIGVSMGIILPELLSSFIWCLPVYFVMKLCIIPIGSRSKFSF